MLSVTFKMRKLLAHRKLPERVTKSYFHYCVAIRLFWQVVQRFPTQLSCFTAGPQWEIRSRCSQFPSFIHDCVLGWTCSIQSENLLSYILHNIGKSAHHPDGFAVQWIYSHIWKNIRGRGMCESCFFQNSKSKQIIKKYKSEVWGRGKIMWP